MTDDRLDPSGNTEQFRAFVNTPDASAPTPGGSRVPLIVGVLAAVVVVAAFLAWLIS